MENDRIFKGKIIALGVCGGIAAYKAVDLASKLTREGAGVKVIMTQNATRFVGPITFQSVTGQPVLTNLFDMESSANIGHVRISEEADILLIAPATANIIAKTAYGIADDALSTTILAARSTVVMVPAMNNHMWLNAAMQHNVEVLKSRGFHIIDPEIGRLACGEEAAVGRFPETSRIIDYVHGLFAHANDLKGTSILVTAGGTHEPIDPVRYIGNRSSGKMGYAIAEEAAARGADVTLISGPTALATPSCVARINVETAQQMYEAVMDNLEETEVVIMSAAVADVRPSIAKSEKIKKERMPKNIGLELNPDILHAIASEKAGGLIVGFAAESENMIEHATDKLQRKSLDLIVANDISIPGVGFGSDFNLAVLIDNNGPIGEPATYRKDELAEKILNWIKDALTQLQR